MSINKQGVFIDFEVPDFPRINKVKQFIINNNYLISDKRIRMLELGYSSGGLLDNLSEFKNVDKYALDLFDKETPDNIKFIKHDCNMGLPDYNGTKFDIVFAGEVIEHIIDDEKFLVDIHKIMNENGLLILTTPNLFFSLNRLLLFLGKMPYFAYAPYHYHIYSVRTLSDMVKKSGFSVYNIQSSHVLYSTRREKILGKIFEYLGNKIPTLGAHIILYAIRN